MTPEERAAIIMANLATMPCGSARWDRCNEMVTHQFRQAVAQERERCARIAEDMEPDKCCGDIAAAIRATPSQQSEA